MAELYRYAAFISYSSKDGKFAQRLHRALESYTVPKSLGDFDLIGGGKKNRIYPVFRDREELSAGHLGERIEAALKASNALVVVCSPNSAASPWVQKEIEYFASLGRRDRIFAIIADDAPVTDANGADCTVACFPPAFRGDALADARALEPLAADARRGKDGFRNAWLKIVAGLVGANPGALSDRDRVRRRRVVLVSSLALVALVSLAAVLLGEVGKEREIREVAEAERSAVQATAAWASVRELFRRERYGEALALASSIDPLLLEERDRLSLERVIRFWSGNLMPASDAQRFALRGAIVSVGDTYVVRTEEGFTRLPSDTHEGFGFWLVDTELFTSSRDGQFTAIDLINGGLSRRPMLAPGDGSDVYPQTLSAPLLAEPPLIERSAEALERDGSRRAEWASREGALVLEQRSIGRGIWDVRHCLNSVCASTVIDREIIAVLTNDVAVLAAEDWPSIGRFALLDLRNGELRELPQRFSRVHAGFPRHLFSHRVGTNQILFLNEQMLEVLAFEQDGAEEPIPLVSVPANSVGIFSPRSDVVIAVTDSALVAIQLTSGRTLWSISGTFGFWPEDSPMRGVWFAASPDGQLFIVATDHGWQLFDVDSGIPLTPFEAAFDRYFSDNEVYLMVGLRIENSGRATFRRMHTLIERRPPRTPIGEWDHCVLGARVINGAPVAIDPFVGAGEECGFGPLVNALREAAHDGASQFPMPPRPE